MTLMHAGSSACWLAGLSWLYTSSIYEGPQLTPLSAGWDMRDDGG